MPERVDMRATRALEELVDGERYQLHTPAPHTPIDAGLWRAIVVDAHCVDSSIPPSDAGLAVLWAQFALETARGTRCYGNNLPNVMRFVGQRFDWCELRTFEFVDPDGAGPRKVERVDTLGTFRVHSDALEGGRRYIEFLRRERWARALILALAGDARGFARELKAKGFYTAPVEEYEAGIVSLAREAQMRFRGFEPAMCIDVRPGLYPLEHEPHARIDPGTGADDWRPQTDARTFLDTLADDDDKDGGST